MTPEERKTMAMRQARRCSTAAQEWFDKTYPNCCSYHEGFDAALGLLTKAEIECYACGAVQRKVAELTEESPLSAIYAMVPLPEPGVVDVGV